MIRVLDAATVGRIAAGEVVERPSSVAKELIENALDAGSTSVTVEIKDGGESYLRVTDNGCGIAPSEVRLAFENHATSKLRDDDDLTDIRTLGFRGEALPSIAAVARVETPWFVDYFHLARYGDRWMIVNALWAPKSRQ